MKQVFRYDGVPIILEPDENGEYVYPKEYTEIPPPEGLYQPIYFDGTKWIGSSKEIFVESLPEIKEVPDKKDEIISALSLELMDLKEGQEKLQRDVAELTLKILEGDVHA